MDQNKPLIAYKEPLSPWAKRSLLAGVIFFHIGAGYALTQIEPGQIVAGEGSPMEVSFVAADQPAQPEQQVELQIPPPEDTPPPEVAMLEAAVLPPEPDLPPPEFPVPPPPPPKPVATPPKPRPPQPAPPQQAAAASAQPGPPAANPGPVNVTASQLQYLNAPPPIYPAASMRRKEQGKVLIRVVVDTSGRPTEVTVAVSSGHKALDEAAVSGVRGYRFKPHIEGGIPRVAIGTIPVEFKLVN